MLNIPRFWASQPQTNISDIGHIEQSPSKLQAPAHYLKNDSRQNYAIVWLVSFLRPDKPDLSYGSCICFIKIMICYAVSKVLSYRLLSVIIDSLNMCEIRVPKNYSTVRSVRKCRELARSIGSSSSRVSMSALLRTV